MDSSTPEKTNEIIRPTQKTSISNISMGNDEGNTLYDSALDYISESSHSSLYGSASERSTSTVILNKNAINSPHSNNNTSTDLEVTLNGADSNLATSSPIVNRNSTNPLHANSALNASMLLIQSESTDTNTSQEEVDPKSQLANKTIFKTDNPNLSIIEINDNTTKEQNLEESVVLIESLSDDDEPQQTGEKLKNLLRKSPNRLPNIEPIINENQGTITAAEKRRKKAESLLQTSKQKLDVAIAEASAAEDNPSGSAISTQAPAGEPYPKTKREIKLYDTIEEFEANLPSTVTVLETPFGSRVYLVGTAHFSEESQDDVSYVIRNVRPDVVMVELCPSRIHILKMDEKTLLEEAKNFNISKIRGILQAHGYINGIFFIMMLQMSAQIAKDLGMAPGGEFRRAFEEIHKLPGCILHLGDRPIRITLYRALRALSLWQTMKLVWRLTSTDSISIEEVEECKQSDLLEKLMQEMAGEFPAFSDVFVKERDLFLCHSLQLAALPQAPANGSSAPRPVRVVGVVGIGHANGIAKMWGRVDPQKIPIILEIPESSLSTRICGYTLKYGLIGLTLFGAFKVLRPRLARLF